MDSTSDEQQTTPGALQEGEYGRNAAINFARHQVDTAYRHEPPNQLKAEQDRENLYDWQQYHNAWQQYYQQYYQRYYFWQYRTHQTRTEALRGAAGVPLPRIETIQQEATAAVQTETQAEETAVAKHTLLSIVKDRAKKFRHSYYFVPLVSALCVGATFLFIQYNTILFANITAYISPGSTVSSTDVVLVDPATNLNVGPEPRLIIPKIDVDTQVFYNITTLDTGPIEAALNNGIVHYNLPGANSLPGQIGNTVLLGHSSNDIFNPGSSKFVFVLLDKLEAGDIFYVNYQGTRYIYRVSKKEVIKPTDIAALQVSTNKPIVTLVTCTPIGTDINRLLVFGDQISPDPATAAQHISTTTGNQNVAVPGNSPSLLDKLFSAF